MLSLINLLLPALMPSWRFFKAVDPSPRVEWALLADAHSTASDWQEFRPRPQHLSLLQMARRMLWNPRRNEALFLVSCAERLTLAPSEHSRQEILHRIEAALPSPAAGEQKRYLQFRLVFIDREEDGSLVKAVTYQSDPHPISGGPAA